jgi:hypothetical protein
MAASQGHVVFRVRPLEGLPSGTVIENTASIHFDLNEAVITNTTLNTLVDCDLFSASISEPVSLLLEAIAGLTYQWSLDGVEIPGATGQQWLAVESGSYTVRVADAFGCTSVSEPYVITNVSVGEREGPRAVVLPNPFGSRARMIFSEVLRAGDVIELIDTHGRTLRQWPGNGTPEIIIERGGLSTGIYMVRLLRNGEQRTLLRVVME